MIIYCIPFRLIWKTKRNFTIIVDKKKNKTKKKKTIFRQQMEKLEEELKVTEFKVHEVLCKICN